MVAAPHCRLDRWGLGVLRPHACLCPQGFEYREQSGRCCGGCVQQACVLNATDSSPRLLYVSCSCRAWLGGPAGGPGATD